MLHELHQSRVRGGWTPPGVHRARQSDRRVLAADVHETPRHALHRRPAAADPKQARRCHGDDVPEQRGRGRDAVLGGEDRLLRTVQDRVADQLRVSAWHRRHFQGRSHRHRQLPTGVRPRQGHHHQRPRRHRDGSEQGIRSHTTDVRRQVRHLGRRPVGGGARHLGRQARGERVHAREADVARTARVRLPTRGRTRGRTRAHHEAAARPQSRLHQRHRALRPRGAHNHGAREVRLSRWRHRHL